MIKWISAIVFLVPLGLLGVQLKTHIELISDPLVGLTTLNQTFNTLGYKLQIETISTRNSVSQIGADVIGSKPLNPAVLAENLQAEGLKLIYVRMNNGTMELGVDATAAVWNVQMLGSDEGAQMQRSGTPYWFRVEERQMISIEPAYGAKWYPDVSVMDVAMRPLYTYRSQTSADEFKLPLPKGAYYLKISNINGMKALKEGMWVESISEGR